MKAYRRHSKRFYFCAYMLSPEQQRLVSPRYGLNLSVYLGAPKRAMLGLYIHRQLYAVEVGLRLKQGG